MNQRARIYVAGHRGIFGRALVRRLERGGYSSIVTVPHSELDLRDERAARDFFARERPEYVFLAAALVGGIVANQEKPIDFLETNLAIELAVLKAASEVDVKGLALFGSSCMYPLNASSAISEGDLFQGPVEPTSRPYAVAKLAGVELCRAYRTQQGRNFFAIVPATLYGPHDQFHSDRAHVIPALMARFHAAKREGLPDVTVLGSGRAQREFLHCDDAAEAAVFLMNQETSLDIVNVGSGEEVSIAELAGQIARVVGFEGDVRFDTRHVDGASRKLLDSRQIRALGWKPIVSLSEGLPASYTWYLDYFGEEVEQACTS